MAKKPGSLAYQKVKMGKVIRSCAHTPTERWNWAGNFQSQLCLCSTPPNTHQWMPQMLNHLPGLHQDWQAVTSLPSLGDTWCQLRTVKVALHPQLLLEHKPPILDSSHICNQLRTCCHRATAEQSTNISHSRLLPAAPLIFPIFFFLTCREAWFFENKYIKCSSTFNKFSPFPLCSFLRMFHPKCHQEKLIVKIIF